MPTKSHHLPQLEGGLFLTDGGLETCLLFHEGLELPCFAAFDLLKHEAGRRTLERYFERYIAIARKAGAGFILESPTWRASADWGDRLGYAPAALDRANEAAIGLMRDLARRHAASLRAIVVSGCVGPRGDGYIASERMTHLEAEAYHGRQIRTFARAGADMVTAITMTNANEAVGIARAARSAGLPIVISFTLETDGRLPTGQSLDDAIAEVDWETSRLPAYYMINCAHPTHFAAALEEGSAWMTRVRGVRANASRRSHQELNDSPDLDAGDPVELGHEHGELLRRFPRINVLGGCCGTDHRHVEAIALACWQPA